MFAFKTKPYEHQKDILEKSWDRPAYALFLEMGTGKSKVAIDNAAMLFDKGWVNAVLVVAPKGVYDNWVQKEIPAHLPDEIPRTVVRWQPNFTKTFMKDLDQILGPDKKEEDLCFFVMNVEALSTSKGMAFATNFLRKNPKNLMIVDESTTIKNRRAQRTKNIVKAGRLAKYKRILTGSPITKSPMDLFSQCQFLSPKALNFENYYAFQGRYAVIVNRKLGHRQFQDIVGYRRLDELNEKLETFSSRVLKEDCLDLPPKTYLRREVPLTEEQQKAYVQMKKLALAQLDTGELASTASVLTQIMRLQQIVSGFLRLDDGQLRELKSNRIGELMDVIDESQGKIIIWATWTADIKRIMAELSKKFGEDSCAAYFGETLQEERQRIVEKFQDPSSPLRFFVGQPKTGGFGITLTEAKNVVYYSNSYDLEIRLQSEDRAHRIGQESKVTYIDLVSPKTIDEKVLQALKDKVNIAEKVLGEEARGWFS